MTALLLEGNANGDVFVAESTDTKKPKIYARYNTKTKKEIDPPTAAAARIKNTRQAVGPKAAREADTGSAEVARRNRTRPML